MSLVPIMAPRNSATPILVGAAALGLFAAGFVLGRLAGAPPSASPRDCPQPLIVGRPLIASGSDDARTLGPRTLTWAASVRDFSSQYATTSWSAQQVLGSPDVYPRHGDIVNAWASQTPDRPQEWIEVGFAQPQHVMSVEIFQTYNPGAISRVELVTASGKRFDAPQGRSEIGQISGGTNQRSERYIIDLPCTAEPIAAVRVELASGRVPGWNEIDAIGVAACAEAP